MVKFRKPAPTSVVIIGLGRFGSAVADSLVRMGQEVLAIDENQVLVERWADELTHVAQADTTDDEALRQLGVGDFDRAVVAIGTDIEASVLTVLALAEAGVPDIWAKAITRKHGAILERVGAHHVIYPEFSMGERVAHMLTGADDGLHRVRRRVLHRPYPRPVVHLGQDTGRVRARAASTA